MRGAPLTTAERVCLAVVSAVAALVVWLAIRSLERPDVLDLMLLCVVLAAAAGAWAVAGKHRKTPPDDGDDGYGTGGYP